MKITENHHFTIDRNALLGLLNAAACNDVRHYLNGVCLDAGPRGAFLVATDGHCMAMMQLTYEACPETEVVIDRDDLKKLQKRGGYLTLEVRKGSNKCRLFDDGTVIEFNPIDGQYPNWGQVVPTSYTGEVGQFDPNVLAKVHAAAAKCAGKPKTRMHGLQILHNGENGAAIVTAEDCEEFLGVIMPRKQDAIGCSWFKPTKWEPKKEKRDGNGVAA